MFAGGGGGLALVLALAAGVVDADEEDGSPTPGPGSISTGDASSTLISTWKERMQMLLRRSARRCVELLCYPELH